MAAGAIATLNMGPVGIFSVGELFGGVERHILGLLSALDARSLTTTLFVFHDGELARQARLQGAEVVVLPSANSLVIATARALSQQLLKRGIRLLHVHGYKATIFAAVARRWNYVSIVKTEHGLPEIVNGQGPQVKARIYHWLDTLTTKRSVDAVCYVSQDLRAKLPKLPNRISTSVIANGVDNAVRTSFPRPIEFNTDHFNLAVVGRLEPVKGHTYAIASLANAITPENVHLHIIGTGPLEAQLRRCAQTRNVASRIHFLGFRSNIYDYLAHCDALLIPSLHEGLPYTLLEAMALAKPMICTRVGGLAEVLQDRVTAILVPAGDAPALASAIRLLHQDHELRQSLGQAALTVQQLHYSLDAMISRYLAVYTSVQPATER